MTGSMRTLSSRFRAFRAVPSLDAAVPAGVPRNAALAGRRGPPTSAPLGPRHVAALEQLRAGQLTAGELASRLGLTMPTVSGVLADLDRAGFVERYPDPADRRRTIVQFAPGQIDLIGRWLDGAASPLARVLDQLNPAEQQAFLKAMSLLETELHRLDATRRGGR